MNDPTAQVDGRRGQGQVNLALDLLVLYTSAHSPACLAETIAQRDIIGHPDSTSHSPIGQWVVTQLADLHKAGELNFVANTFSWRGWLAIFDPAMRLIGEVAIPTDHPLYVLECQANDRGTALIYQGPGYPR